jgi:predicted RNA binding protein YcfA (HicA-like mRNA interferase family)
MPTAKELLRFLSRQGYRRVRQTGSHLILSHPDRALLVIPMHVRDLPKGLFLKIL